MIERSDAVVKSNTVDTVNHMAIEILNSLNSQFHAHAVAFVGLKFNRITRVSKTLQSSVSRSHQRLLPTRSFLQFEVRGQNLVRSYEFPATGQMPDLSILKVTIFNQISLF